MIALCPFYVSAEIGVVLTRPLGPRPASPLVPPFRSWLSWTSLHDGQSGRRAYVARLVPGVYGVFQLHGLSALSQIAAIGSVVLAPRAGDVDRLLAGLLCEPGNREAENGANRRQRDQKGRCLRASSTHRIPAFDRARFRLGVEANRQSHRAGKACAREVHDAVGDQAAPLDRCAQHAIQQVARDGGG